MEILHITTAATLKNMIVTAVVMIPVYCFSLVVMASG